jgi:hypothetical protein
MDRIELQLGKKYSVGRSSKCNIIVNDKHISSVHCIIWPAPHDPSDARHEVDTDLNKVLPCIEDCSSNGTWLYSARDRRKPKSHSSTKCTSAATKLEQGSKTILSTDDCFHLKSPKVFCDSSIGFTVKIDYGKHVALEPLQSSFTEYGSIEDVIKVEHPKEHVQDLDPNTSPLLTSDIEDLSIPSTKKPKVVKLTSDTNPLLGSQEEHCPTCLSVFALPELIDHAQVCCKQHYLQGKESISITEGVSSQSKDSKENEPRDLELCGYCLKEFPVVDLVQHASSCSSRSEHVISSITMVYVQPKRKLIARIYLCSPVKMLEVKVLRDACIASKTSQSVSLSFIQQDVKVTCLENRTADLRNSFHLYMILMLWHC